jgi:hypothetical protein
METAEFRTEAAILLAMMSLIAGAIIVLALAMNNRRKLREMDHRERLAMIDRGLMPPPEVDPAGFESVMGSSRPSAAAARARAVGIITIGIGVALMMLISFAGGAPGPGVGVGGAIAVLGLAFLLTGMLSSESPSSTPQPPPLQRSNRTSSPPSPPEPPHNIAP